MRIIFNKNIIVLLLIIIIPILYSQNYPEIYNFDKVKELAILNNLTLKDYENQMKLAKLSYDQAVSNLYFPSITLSSSTNINPDSNDNPSGSLSLTLSKPIFNGLALKKAKDLAYLNYNYKKSLYEAKIFETRYLVFQYYYQFLERLLEYRLYSEILKINENRMDEYSTKYELGLITELTYISLNLTFYKVSLAKKNAEKEKDLAYLKLKNFLNEKIDFKIVEEMNLDNIDFSKIFIKKEIEKDIESSNLNFQNLLSDAKKYNAAYLGALLNYNQTDLNLRYYIANLFPDLSTSLGISYNGIYNSIFDTTSTNQPSFNISISISLDLDSLIPFSSKNLEQKELKKELENSKINLQKAENDLILSLQTSLKNIDLSKITWENALIEYDYAIKGYNLAEDAFNTGQISVSDYASWEEEYVNAKISLYSAILTYQLNLQTILLAIGKLD